MKTAGIILVCLQVIVTIAGIINGSVADMLLAGGVRTVGNLIGYFIPGIIGIILIVKAKKKSTVQNQSEKEG